MNDDELKRLEAEAVGRAVNWAKTGMGYFTMEKKVNEYISATGADQAAGNDEEAIRYGRRAAALRINIMSISELTKAQEQSLHDTLIKIAEDGVTKQNRGFHR